MSRNGWSCARPTGRPGRPVGLEFPGDGPHLSLMTTTRSAAVAGLFYPGDPQALAAEVEGYLAEAKGPGAPPPKAIIAPHAGYI